MNPQKTAKKAKGRDLTNTMVCWTPGGEVALIPWPDPYNASGAYSRSVGACFTSVRNAPYLFRQTQAFVDAVHLVVRDGCDPAKVHAAFLGLEEYLDGCANDMPGVWALRKEAAE